MILTMLVGLMVGWLLNAPGILKTAESMPFGWQRDVAIAFAKPVAAVSSALRLDVPREILQDIAGRGGEDQIEVALPSPTTTTTAAPQPTRPGETVPPSTTVPAAPPVFTPEVPMRVWVGGDSLSITPGESLMPRLDGTGAATAVGPVDGQVATGLARPEVFNWPQHLVDVVNTHDPDAMVLTIGSNDDQSLTYGPDGTVGGVGSDAWREEYRRRVGGLMDSVATDGRLLFYVGIPIIRDTDRFARGYEVINQIVREEAEKRPTVFYVDSWQAVSGENAEYMDFRPNPDGSVTQIRSGDGIHFTRAGGDLIADAIMNVINSAADLTSWRDARPMSQPTPQPGALVGPSASVGWTPWRWT